MQITATEPRTKVQGRRSHFAFKNWVYGADGKRLGAVPVRPVTSAAADLVSTCYTNPGKGTKTVYCLQWDLDAHRADTHLLDKRGCLKSAVILKTLRAEQPELMRHIFAVTRSTSGKGLSVAIPISPLELVPATERAQRAARALQKKVLELFNHYGFGADPGALGLDRDFANWHNQTRTVRYVRPLLDAVQSDRTPVVRRLLRVLNHCPQLAYKKKKERSGLLYPDLRAERKLALLYLAALEGDGWSQKVIAEVIADTHLTDLIADTHLTTREIAQSTGLSLSFLQKFLHAPPPWLKAEWLGKHEGWRLTVRFAKELSVRALELCPQSHLNHSREIPPLRCIPPRLGSGPCRA